LAPFLLQVVLDSFDVSHALRCVVSGSVIDNNDLRQRIFLGLDALNRFDNIISPIVGWDND
jgi:hypothetical protein